MIEFAVIGTTDPEASRVLQSGLDPCFGKNFAKTAPECIACRSPVIVEGKVLLMKEVCALAHLSSLPATRINRLNSQQVLERLERGVDLKVIFREILGDAPAEHYGVPARQLLVDRLIYLRSLSPDGLPESVPKLKDLLE